MGSSTEIQVVSDVHVRIDDLVSLRGRLCSMSGAALKGGSNHLAEGIKCTNKTMDQHKYILASDTGDVLGTWTESNIIEVQSHPEPGNGARGIVVQGVGMTKQKLQQHQLTAVSATSARKGGPQQPALTEHYTHQLQVVTSAPPTTSIPTSTATAHTLILRHQDAGGEQGESNMINTLRPAKTKLGKARIRMKWTTEVNEYILRTYYYITQLETNCKHYRDTLHRMFNEEYPDVDVCAQRIADQRRAIVKNHLLTQERIDEIRKEVELELQHSGVVLPAQQPVQGTPTIMTSSVGGALTVSTPVITISKEHPSPVAVWYGCVKEEPPTEGYHVPGPSSHKLRKLNQGEIVPGGGGGGVGPQTQHIIIHTTSAAAAAALGVSPHALPSSAEVLKR